MSDSDGKFFGNRFPLVDIGRLDAADSDDIGTGIAGGAADGGTGFFLTAKMLLRVSYRTVETRILFIVNGFENILRFFNADASNCSMKLSI